MIRPCSESDRVHALVDGELGDLEADLVRDHLADCAACQEELADALQVAAAAAELVELEAPARAPVLVSVPALGTLVGGDARASGSSDPVVAATAPTPAAAGADPAVRSIDTARRRRARRVGLAAGLALPAAAAAAWALFAPGAGRAPAPQAAVAIALPAQRGLEARMAWAPATGHRPYGVARDGSVAAGAPLAVLAELERRGDLHGVGALYLLAGDTRQAEGYLSRAAPADPRARADLAADRAALELGRGDAAAALTIADGALAEAPGHAAARWNRALALRDLGLTESAIDELEAVAARGEPGWSTEAAERAGALRRDADARRALDERILAGGIDLVAGGPGFSIDDARRRRGMGRLFLLDALRAAPTRERVLALRPLAEAVDDDGRLVRAAEVIAASDFARRAPLARRYAAIRAGEPLVGAARGRYLADLRRAGASDILFGALVLLGPDGRTVAADELAELGRLGRASGDPWLELVATEQEAAVAVSRGDLLAAESVLLGAAERCRAAALPYRCMRIQSTLGELHVDLHRLPEARRALDEAWRLARTEAIAANLDNLYAAFADLHSVSDDAVGAGLALTRAYAGEMVRRHPDSCDERAWAHELAAKVLLNQIRFDEAARELAEARPPGHACAATPMALPTAFVAAHLLRERGTDGEVAGLRAELARLRAAPDTTPAQRALVDHSEGRLLVERDPAAGRALLEASIRAADELPAWSAEARKARAYSYTVLATDAARRGDGERALALLAREEGLEPPARCALGVAVDDDVRVAVVRGADGAAALHVDRERRTPAVDPATLVPPALVARLTGCEAVDVLARPPLHGLPGLLPDSLVWRYLSARRRPLADPPPISARPLVVSDVEPPAALGLPRLAPWPDDAGQRVSGPDATPARVLDAMRGATAVEVHAHGLVNLGQSDASFLALSPDAAGRYALSAGDVRAATLGGAPLVVLAACRASRGAAVLHEPWSLPSAFVYAGARAVIASAEPIPDADARAFFGDLRARIEGGHGAALALRDARRAWLSGGRGAWVRGLVVFE